jgi:hypothetical protein
MIAPRLTTAEIFAISSAMTMRYPIRSWLGKDLRWRIGPTERFLTETDRVVICTWLSTPFPGGFD